MKQKNIIIAFISLACISACSVKETHSDDPLAGSNDPQTNIEQPAPITSVTPAPAPKAEDLLNFFPQGTDQLKVLCARPGNDRVRALFCLNGLPHPAAPAITSLVQLRNALGLNIDDAGVGFALTGHSSSLVSRQTNSINPRAVFFHKSPNVVPNYASLGFVPGEQLVEIATKDASNPNPNTNVKFFLVAFKQACNNTPQGCTHGDLLGTSIQNNWVATSIYEAEDLKNTQLDCLQCHQPQGPNSPRILRMQELQIPWTHWMFTKTPGGQALLSDFAAARANETYASIPAARIAESDPETMEVFIRQAGFANQPNEFLSAQVETEVQASAPQQPIVNIPFGQSNTWEALFANFLSGTVIRPPYHDVKVTDPVKLNANTMAYRDFVNGTISGAQLPDIRESHFEPQMWAMGYKMKPGSTPQQLLMQACGQCHNQRLDQSLSRARFNVDLTQMSRAQKDAAIARLNLQEDHLFSMPPKRFMELNAFERAAIKNLLEQ